MSTWAHPPHVTMYIWRVPARRIVRVLWRIALDRRRLRRTPGVRFAKLLGTGSGGSFRPGHADLTRWAALVVWDDANQAAEFDRTRVSRSWRTLATSWCRIELRPLTSRGTWSGSAPFDVQPPATTSSPNSASLGPVDHGDGPILVLTRARLRLTGAVAFWRAIAPVATAVHQAPGMLATFALGEAPLGWQGTVSLWRTTHDLVKFAYRHPDHQQVIEHTRTRRWYVEELFARFAVTDVCGDPAIIAWAEERTAR